MFRVRTYLINGALVFMDLTVTASMCLATERGARPSRVGLVLAVWLAAFLYFGMYRSRRMHSLFSDVKVVAKAALAAWILLAASGRAAPEFAAANFFAVSSTRFFLRVGLRALRRRGLNVKRLVLVASPVLGRRLAERIEQRAHYGYRIVRSFTFEDGSAGVLDDFRQFLRSSHVDEVILGLPARAQDLLAQFVAECEDRGVHVHIAPDLFPLIQADARIYDLDGIPLVSARLYPTHDLRYAIGKRAFDVCFSLAALILLSPLFVAIAALIKATSPGPVFFVQERIGLSGRKFRMLKFRTMHVTPGLDPDSHWTVANDPNVTRLGRWLRRANLDELPQFFNVLMGDMSIVGPRPERPFFLERFRREVPEYMTRHYVKTGITGWAQIHGWRGDTRIDARVAHDLYYIRNWAMTLDIKIILLTLVRTIFQRPGI